MPAALRSARVLSGRLASRGGSRQAAMSVTTPPGAGLRDVGHDFTGL